MINSTFTQTIQVSENQTALYLGSGSLPVFGTPALIALMENTSMKLLADLPTGSSSVGISMNMKHTKASLVGTEIQCTATIIAIEGRKYTFKLEATDKAGDSIGEGIHERVVVDIAKFMTKIQ